MSSSTYTEYKSATLSIFFGLKEYFKKYWSTLFIFILLAVFSQIVAPPIAWVLAIFFWIITCDQINYLRNRDRLEFESIIRDKEIKDNLEKIRSSTLEKYNELLNTKKYDELVEKLKEIK